MQEIPGAGRRLAASLIDSLILGVFGFLLGRAFEDQFVQLEHTGRFLGFLIAGVYFVILESSPRAASIGKRLLSMRVINEEGFSPSAVQTAIRYSILSIPFFLNGSSLPPALEFLAPFLFIIIVLGILQVTWLVLFDKRSRRGLHERWSGTRVVFAGEPLPELQSTPRHVCIGLAAVCILTFGGLGYLFLNISQDEQFAAIQTWADKVSEKYPNEFLGMNLNVHHDGVSESRQLVVTLKFTRPLTEETIAERAQNIGLALSEFSPTIPSKITLVGVYGFDIGIYSQHSQKTSTITLDTTEPAP